MDKATTVDAYIAAFPQATRALLTTLRATILQAAPQAEEGFGYGMPAYRFHGPLVYFAGYANHIGLYPTGTGIKAFEAELAGRFTWSKGAVQFPLDQPLPLDLIVRMVRFKIDDNQQQAATKQLKTKQPKTTTTATKQTATKQAATKQTATKQTATKAAKATTKATSGATSSRRTARSRRLP
jgi:uncharacterized protein YdhG (YjbR/CyaY superfamily)